MKTLLVYPIALLCVVQSVISQTTRYVNPGGCGGNSPCYSTIQAAINASVAGDIIQVSSGTYNEALSIGISLDLEGVSAGTTIINASGLNLPAISITSGTIKIRKFCIKEDNANTKSCLYVTGGTVDAGLLSDKGLNQFLVYGAGSAIDNNQAVALGAIGNYWGTAKGPTISTNYCGNGGAIAGTNASNVSYSPWKDDELFSNDVTPEGPVTTASLLTVCAGTTTVDIPITVSSFTNVGTISLTLSYDASKLGTAALLSKHASLWENFTVNTAISGTIIVSGYGTGITLSGTPTLLTIRFTKLTPITNGSLSFVENVQGTSCEYAPDAPPLFAPFCDKPTGTYYIAGGVTVYNTFTAGSIATTGETSCYNGDPVAIGSVTPGSGGDETITYRWQSSTDAGFTSPADISSNTAIYDPPSGLTVTTWYRRQAKDGTCNTSWNTSTGTWKVTVRNQFSAGSIETTGETICYGGDPAVIGSLTPSSGGDESITYQWQSSTNIGFTSPTDISSNTATYNPPSGLTVTTWYRRQAKDGTCNTSWNTSSGVWKVTVRNQFTAGSIETTGETICYGGDPATIGSLTPSSGGDESITYQWQSSTNIGFTSSTDISSNTATYNPPSGLTVTTWYRRQAKDGTCNTSWTTSTGTWKVTVRNQFSAGSIETTGETICYGGDPAVIGSLTPSSGGDESITYQWQSSTNIGFTSPTDISSNTATYNPPSGLTVTTWYRRQAKDGTCNTSWNTSSGVWKVTVRNQFTAGSIETTGETICYGGDPATIGSLTPSSGGDESITYQWQSSTNIGFTSSTDISSNTATYNPPSGLTVTTWYRRQAKDGTCNTSWNTSAGVWKVTVRAQFTAGSIATTGETICYNGDPAIIGSITPSSGGDESITYSWQSSTDAGFTSPTDLSFNTTTYNPPSGLTVTTWYRRQAKDGTCNTSWNTSAGVWKVTVRNQFTAGSIETAGETICYNGDPAIIGSITPSSGGDESITYQWQSSTDVAFTSPTDLSFNTTTYNPPSGLTVTTWYRRQAKDGTCNTSWNTSAGVWKVTVRAQFTAGSIATTGETICYNGDPAVIGSLSPASGGDETITYQWQSSTDAGFSSPTNINSNTATYDPLSGLIVTTWYRRQAKDGTCNTSWNTSAGAWKVTVRAQFTAGSIETTGETICSGGDPVTMESITPAGGGDEAITYQWQSSTDAGFTSPTNISSNTLTYNPPSGLTVTTWYRRQAKDGTCNTSWNSSSGVWKVTVSALQSITGNITYYNMDLTPLNNYITIRLYKGGSLVGSDSIQPSHTTYSFPNLCPGSYEIRATSTLPTDGSVNTTDAAQENWWAVYPYTIERVNFYTGDVAGDLTYPDFNNYLNATDAHLIQQNFVYQTAFDRTNTWSFWRAGETYCLNPAPCGDMQYPALILQPGVDLTANIYALCTGDFNRSFDPSLGKSGGNKLQLIYGTTRQICHDQEFDLPVRIENPTEVGAISMILNFPSELVEVKDVLIEGTVGQLDWTMKGNELRIGWNSMTPLDITAGSTLLTLRMRTTAAFTEGASIRITMVSNPGNELADDQYNPIDNAVISVDMITASSVGIMEQNTDNGFTVNNHPNPFSRYTTITYTLPSEGYVTFEIRNLLGKTVVPMVNEAQSEGNHSLNFDAIDLGSGIYMATLRFSTKSDEIIRTIKLVRYK